MLDQDCYTNDDVASDTASAPNSSGRRSPGSSAGSGPVRGAEARTDLLLLLPRASVSLGTGLAAYAAE